MRHFLILALGAVIGCGGKAQSGLVDVSGMVTLDAKPLSGAEVKLVSDKVTGFARTGTEGKFQLVQGVPPGTYKVVISKIEGGQSGERKLAPGEEKLDPGQLGAIEIAQETDPKQTGKASYQSPKETIPADFSSLQQTKLSLDVPKTGTKTADFKLTSQ